MSATDAPGVPLPARGAGLLPGEGAAPRAAAAARRVRRRPHPFVLARRTVAAAWDARVLGLAAEAGFWQLLSLAPLLLVLLGLIGYTERVLGRNAVDSVRSELLRVAARVLTPDSVNDVVRPTITAVLGKGRADLVSVGSVLSLWSGSSAMATFVNTITIAYDQRHLRGAVRSRLVALWLYLCSLVLGMLVLPLLALGPGVLERLGHGSARRTLASAVRVGYWPVLAVVSIVGLTTLYHVALPRRHPWRRAVPGAVLAFVVWLAGAFVVRTYLLHVFTKTSAFGSLAAPVAALLFFYVTALAVLLGAFLNAQAEALSSGTRPGGALEPGEGSGP